jgi:hypothetical protein
MFDELNFYGDALYDFSVFEVENPVIQTDEENKSSEVPVEDPKIEEANS